MIPVLKGLSPIGPVKAYHNSQNRLVLPSSARHSKTWGRPEKTLVSSDIQALADVEPNYARQEKSSGHGHEWFITQ